MSQRYLGGVITANPTTPTTASASGVWTLEQQFQYLQGVSPRTIGNSVRLRSSASAYFNRTPASASNQQKWTWSGWVKRGVLGSGYQELFGARTGSSGTYALFWFYNDTLTFQTSATSNITTTSVYRDPSAWYHVVLSVDTAQATAANRTLLYVNGTQVTAFSTATYPTQNSNLNVNSTAAHFIGQQNSSEYFDGYMAEVNFVDGQALTPSSFGAFDGNGVWQPLPYAGTYGTNGFYLTFADNSAATATTLGKDYSGNGNNWTPNNISVTAGVTYDWMLDSPSNYADGGNGRGNYATWNAVTKSPNLSLTAGNLNTTYSSTTNESVGSTIGVTSGKWYWESTATNVVSSFPILGIAKAAEAGLRSISGYYPGYSTNSWGLWCNTGGFINNATTLATYSTVSTNDVLMFALDMDSGKYWMGKNGTWFNSGVPASGTGSILSSGLTGETIFPMVAEYNGSSESANFGQRPFAYTPPTGFLALNTQNLPAVNINKGAQYMDVTLLTGSASDQSITSLSFAPDFLWSKCRNNAVQHGLFDTVRGGNKILVSNDTAAEATISPAITFLPNGVTLPRGYSVANDTGRTYVEWFWKAGGTAVSNTNGSITSSVSANTTAGFSIVTYTGTGGTATVGHGLGVAPRMIIVKERSPNTDNWNVYHASLGNSAWLQLNTTSATQTGSEMWNNTSPTSTVMTVRNPGSGGYSNRSGANYVAYCFAAVAGYSAFGSYTGNGSADGPFVYCGFRPRFVMIKRTDNTGFWTMLDSSRLGYNVTDKPLYANASNAESTAQGTDFIASGFKVRATDNDVNTSGGTYIYAAFAENPFNIARAR